MTPPDADGMTLLGKILGSGAMIGGIVAAPILWIETRLRGKADKQETQKNIEKLADKIDANHREVMNLLLQHFNHNGAKQ